MKVAVRDSKNHDRLLGYFPRCSAHLPWLRVALLPKVHFVVSSDYEAIPVEIKYVQFNFGYFTYEGGWTMKKEMFTDAPLEDLLQLRDFSLPGESIHSTYLRQKNA